MPAIDDGLENSQLKQVITIADDLLHNVLALKAIAVAMEKEQKTGGSLDRGSERGLEGVDGGGSSPESDHPE